MTKAAPLTTVLATIPQEISEERVSTLLCSAFEGGSNYWVGIQKYEYPAGKTRKDFEFRHIEVVLAGGKQFLYDAAEDNGNEKYDAEKKELWTLTREKLIKGLNVMANLKKGHGAHHWPNFLAENDDAETGDVYLQCCLFGEIVYG